MQVGGGAGGEGRLLLLVVVPRVLLVDGLVLALVLLVEGGDVLVVPLAVAGALAVDAQLHQQARRAPHPGPGCPDWSGPRRPRARAAWPPRSRLCSMSCRSRCPDRPRCAPRRHPALTAKAVRSSSNGHLGHDVVVTRVVLHRARLAEHVHEADVAPVSAASAASPDRAKAVTSLTIVGAGGERGLGDAAFEVSTEIATPGPAAARPSTTGSTRRSSWSTEPARRPAASTRRRRRAPAPPSAASRRPCATAASGSRNRPPSENESGVTLRRPSARAGVVDGHQREG